MKKIFLIYSLLISFSLADEIAYEKCFYSQVLKIVKNEQPKIATKYNYNGEQIATDLFQHMYDTYIEIEGWKDTGKQPSKEVVQTKIKAVMLASSILERAGNVCKHLR
ncbi:MAG: hypothetical protein LBT96_02925 [Campylobacteraceae bacterium]|jgi:hypothetical protein|nr:hypothetical protein [Campylobacteraceae bacterium]